MALICRKCLADVTEDYDLAPAQTPFKCKCGSKHFRHQVDPPKTPYCLNVNDERLLRRHERLLRMFLVEVAMKRQNG